MHLISKLHDLAWEARLQIDTTGLKPSLHPDGVRYGASPYRSVGKALDLLRLTPEDHFVDIGCGKGRVLVMASRRKLQRITGVEYDEELAAQARANVDMQVRKTTPDVTIHVASAEAVDYSGCTAGYMFNPFEPVLLDKVLFAIEETAPTTVFRLVFVNCNQAQQEVFFNRGWKRLRAKLIAPYTRNETIVFVAREHEAVGDVFAA
jgi:precorrin-6B methylase 2